MLNHAESDFPVKIRIFVRKGGPVIPAEKWVLRRQNPKKFLFATCERELKRTQPKKFDKKHFENKIQNHSR